MDFKLQNCDVLVNINDRRDPYSSFKRWVMGNPYEHVFIYLGRMKLDLGQVAWRIPMLFESDGDGVVIESLVTRYGQKVVVMRLKSEFDAKRIDDVIEQAVKLAYDAKAEYDYRCITRFVLPRLICQKLGLPIPLAWHRDRRQICSEAVFEIFYRAKLVDILRPGCVPPMPGDFVTDSLLLEEVHRGILTAEWVS